MVIGPPENDGEKSHTTNRQREQNSLDTSQRIERAIRRVGVVMVSIIAATMPAAAFVDEFGNMLGNRGGAQVMVLVWFVILVISLAKGGGRLYRALDHAGSHKNDKRLQGREEMVPAALSAFGLPILILTISAFVSRIMPESWSWLGVDLTQYISIPGIGAGGGGGGNATQAAAGQIMANPEIVETLLTLA